MELFKPNQDIKAALKYLEDDDKYYGDFGKQFISYSDIKTLLSDPRGFKQRQEDNQAFAQGRLFHQMLLEPEKVQDFPVIDVASRNSKAYKEAKIANNNNFLLLTKEVDAVKEMVSSMKGNFEIFDSIYAEGNKFEVPAIQMIKGFPFKGKADIVAEHCVIDLKTAGNLHEFKWSARRYHYDAQAYIYQYLFGKPLIFYVIDKSSHLLGRAPSTAEFVKSGEKKVERAIEVYEKYFGKSPTEDVENHIVDIEL